MRCAGSNGVFTATLVSPLGEPFGGTTRYIPVSVASRCTSCALRANGTSLPDGEMIRVAGPGRSNSPVESDSADSSTECVIHSTPPAINNGKADCKGKLEL